MVVLAQHQEQVVEDQAPLALVPRGLATFLAQAPRPWPYRSIQPQPFM
jgi:hypothetical protein